MPVAASAESLFVNALTYGAALAATWAAAQLVSLWTLNLPVSDMLKVHDLQLYSEENPAEAAVETDLKAKGQYKAGQAAEEALEQEAMMLQTPPYRFPNESSGGGAGSRGGSGGSSSSSSKQRRMSHRMSWSSSIRRLPSFSPREMYEQKVLAASTANPAKGPRVAPPKGHKPNPKALAASNEAKAVIEAQGGSEKLIAELRASVQDLLDASADARTYCDDDTMMRCTSLGRRVNGEETRLTCRLCVAVIALTLAHFRPRWTAWRDCKVERIPSENAPVAKD